MMVMMMTICLALVRRWSAIWQKTAARLFAGHINIKWTLLVYFWK